LHIRIYSKINSLNTYTITKKAIRVNSDCILGEKNAHPKNGVKTE
jgi:hypothetical protein